MNNKRSGEVTSYRGFYSSGIRDSSLSPTKGTERKCVSVTVGQIICVYYYHMYAVFESMIICPRAPRDLRMLKKSISTPVET